jgi:hypothetical protein
MSFPDTQLSFFASDSIIEVLIFPHPFTIPAYKTYSYTILAACLSSRSLSGATTAVLMLGRWP